MDRVALIERIRDVYGEFDNFCPSMTDHCKDKLFNIFAHVYEMGTEDEETITEMKIQDNSPYINDVPNGTYSYEQTAKILQCTTRTLRKIILAKKLKAKVRRPGTSIIVMGSDIRKYLDNLPEPTLEDLQNGEIMDKKFEEIVEDTENFDTMIKMITENIIDSVGNGEHKLGAGLELVDMLKEAVHKVKKGK